MMVGTAKAYAEDGMSRASGMSRARSGHAGTCILMMLASIIIDTGTSLSRCTSASSVMDTGVEYVWLGRM